MSDGVRTEDPIRNAPLPDSEAPVTPDTDQPTTLYPDRRPALGLLALAGLVMAGGAWMAWQIGAIPGAIVAGFGFLVLIGALGWLIPSRSYLHLTDRGFICCRWFRTFRVDWQDVDRFGVATVEDEPRVGYDYAPHYPADVFDRRRTKDRTGFEAILPRCCSLRPEPLADLLNRRIRRADRA